MNGVATICFYCKKLVTTEGATCPHCARRRRLIRVPFNKVKVSKWWQKAKFEYHVLNVKYTYVEPLLAEANL